MRVTSSASSSASGGRIPGSRRASIVLPVPGGPARSRLWRPAAAISSARRPRRCPFTSARSGQAIWTRPFCDRWRRLGQPVSAHVGDRLGEVVHGNGVDARQRHLARRLRGAEHELDPRAPGALGDDQRAPDRPYPAIQSQLPHRGVLPERAGRNLVRGGENGERDRQIEAGALLAQLRGRQVDGDAPERPDQLGRDDAAAHALLGLLAGAIGQPDDRKGGNSLLQVRLDLHPPRLQPDERVGQHLREHVIRLGGEASRVCHESGPKATLEPPQLLFEIRAACAPYGTSARAGALSLPRRHQSRPVASWRPEARKSGRASTNSTITSKIAVATGFTRRFPEPR